MLELFGQSLVCETRSYFPFLRQNVLSFCLLDCLYPRDPQQPDTKKKDALTTIYKVDDLQKLRSRAENSCDCLLFRIFFFTIKTPARSGDEGAATVVVHYLMASWL